MEWVLAVAAATAVAAVLIIGHYAFWTWRLRQPIEDDGVVRAITRDGWHLALGTRHPRAPERRPPVLLVHGLSANRWTLDAGLEEVSLAAYLSREGFRTFSLDLRGHGDSRRGPAGAGPWTFDDYVESDVPAALDAVRRETGDDRVLWVGHSLGAVAGMVSCQLHPERIAAIVAIAGPMSFDVEGVVARHVRQGTLVDGRYNRTVARMVAPCVSVMATPTGIAAMTASIKFLSFTAALRASSRSISACFISLMSCVVPNPPSNASVLSNSIVARSRTHFTAPSAIMRCSMSYGSPLSAANHFSCTYSRSSGCTMERNVS